MEHLCHFLELATDILLNEVTKLEFSLAAVTLWNFTSDAMLLLQTYQDNVFLLFLYLGDKFTKPIEIK